MVQLCKKGTKRVDKKYFLVSAVFLGTFFGLIIIFLVLFSNEMTIFTAFEKKNMLTTFLVFFIYTVFTQMENLHIADDCLKKYEFFINIFQLVFNGRLD